MSKITLLSRELLVPSGFQPRSFFSEEAISELALSVKNHGILQPLIVRRAGGRYEIVAGERRYRAASLVGLKKLPCIIMELSVNDALAIALVENIQRQDLNPIEEALAYMKLKEVLKIKQDDVAQIVGKDRATVANMMRLLRLPDVVKDFLKNNELSMGHARAILALSDPDMQIMIAKKVIRESLSVRGVEKLIRVLKLGHNLKVSKNNDNDIAIRREIEKKLAHFFGLKVMLKKESHGLSMVISMHDESQINHILDILNIEI